MEIQFIHQSPAVIFRLDAVDARYESALRESGWTEDGGGWQRAVSEEAPDLDRVRQTFAASAETMFRQLAGIEITPWEAALEAFAERADAVDMSWWLTGSAATALRVPGISPHDIDVMFEPDNEQLVRETFADVIVQPIESIDGWVVRRFGVAFLHARIDLAADPMFWVDDPEPADFGRVAARQLETVSWRGRAMRVPSLALQAAVNRRRGRIERAAAIEAMLADRQHG